MRCTNMLTLDLNLLRALKVLLDEKHITRAANRIGLSQPAMSRALQRLRHAFNDQLLVRGSTGLDLTARAIELYEPLQNIFLDLNQLVAQPFFDPAIAQAEITIATRDYEVVTILPSVINALSKEAPNLKLRVIPLNGDDLSPLDKHGVDFILSGSESKSAMLYRKKLFTENFVCLISAKEAKQKFTLNKYLKMKHCLITITGDGLGVVDELLAEQDLKREISVYVPHFLAASHIVANSNLIVTLPRRLGLLLSDNKKIKLVEVPLAIPDFPIYLYWHSRNNNNPMHQWVRKTITSTVA